MKKVIVSALFFLSFSGFSQTKEIKIKNWFQNVINDMIEMNDLSKYSHKEINYKLDFIMVESIKELEVNGNEITMLVNHGAGKFCTKITFQYLEKNNSYYLVFQKPRKSKVLKTSLITPWTKRINNCK